MHTDTGNDWVFCRPIAHVSIALSTHMCDSTHGGKELAADIWRTDQGENTCDAGYKQKSNCKLNP